MDLKNRQINEASCQAAEEAGPRKTGSAELCPTAPSGQKAEHHPALRSVDCVEIASMDSFPCSDPPGYYPIST